MENGDPATQRLAGPAGMIYLILGFQPRKADNGDAYQLPGRKTSSHYITDYLASGLGNGEWRRMRCTCCQLPGPGANVIDQWGLGNVAMEPME